VQLDGRDASIQQQGFFCKVCCLIAFFFVTSLPRALLEAIDCIHCNGAEGLSCLAWRALL